MFHPGPILSFPSPRFRPNLSLETRPKSFFSTKPSKISIDSRAKSALPYLRNLSFSPTIDRIRRQTGGVFVDKTRYLAKLVSAKSVQHQFIRPRRFGKSTLIRLLEDLCSNDPEELFQGTELSKVDYLGNSLYRKGRKPSFFQVWKATNRLPIPCLTFDFNAVKSEDSEAAKWGLFSLIEKYAVDYSIQIEKKVGFPLCLKMLIAEIARKEGKPVFVLVDEYDKLLTVTDPGVQRANISLMRDFFSAMKDHKDIQYAFVTGITKTDIFLKTTCNHLIDITLDPDFQGMCGFTESEVRKYVFPDPIISRFLPAGKSKEAFFAELKTAYFGYKFAKHDPETLFNPWSILQCWRNKGDIEAYWGSSENVDREFQSILRKRPDIAEGVRVRGMYTLAHEKREEEKTEERQVSALWMQGFLTIHHYEDGVYHLKPSNTEARSALLQMIHRSVHGITEIDQQIARISLAGSEQNLPCFLQTLNDYLKQMVCVNFRTEQEVECFLHQLFLLMNVDVHRQEVTAGGKKVDLLARFRPGIAYFIEVKLNKSAKKALDQVEERGYAEGLRMRERDLIVIELGLNYSQRNRVGKYLTGAANRLTLGSAGNIIRTPIYPLPKSIH